MNDDEPVDVPHLWSRDAEGVKYHDTNCWCWSTPQSPERYLAIMCLTCKDGLGGKPTQDSIATWLSEHWHKDPPGDDQTEVSTQ